MKRIFAFSLLLSSPLFAMNGSESLSNTQFLKELNKDAGFYSQDSINAYAEMFASAAANNQLERLRALAKSGFDSYMDRPNALGATPLYWACQNGHTEIVRYLLFSARAEASKKLMLGLPNQKTPCTALHIAAIKGHLEIVEALVNGASSDLDSQHAPKNRTPLHYAIANGQTKIAALLLTKKATFFLPDEDKNTALSLAAKCEYDPALTEAFSKGNIINAASSGWETDISGLIAIKANLEEVDPKNKATPLIWAANEGHTKVVKLLLDAGANIHAKNKDGLTALDCAKKRNMLDAATALEEALTKAQALDDKGKDEATN